MLHKDIHDLLLVMNMDADHRLLINPAQKYTRPTLGNEYGCGPPVID